MKALIISTVRLSVGFLIFGVFTNLALASDDCDYEKIKDEAHHSQYGTQTSYLLKEAVKRNCSDLMDQILKKEDSDKLFHETEVFARDATNELGNEAESLKGKYEDDSAVPILQNKLKILAKFKAFLVEKCPVETKESDACKARMTFTDYGERFKKRMDFILAEEGAEAKKAAYRNSPEFFIDGVCACDKFIKLNQEKIEREKEIGKVSGSVNMATLNRAGSEVVDIKKMKKKILINYKNNLKKELKTYQCTDVETLTNPLLWDKVGVRDSRFAN